MISWYAGRYWSYPGYQYWPWCCPEIKMGIDSNNIVKSTDTLYAADFARENIILRHVVSRNLAAKACRVVGAVRIRQCSELLHHIENKIAESVNWEAQLGGLEKKMNCIDFQIGANIAHQPRLVSSFACQFPWHQSSCKYTAKITHMPKMISCGKIFGQEGCT